MFSIAEENYLKAIYHLGTVNEAAVSTGALAAMFGIQAPSVTEMLKRMDEKGLVVYTKSRGVQLTEYGRRLAIAIVRRHRIWETFLVNTLGFDWGEVHELAEQLEHIRSEDMVNRLDRHLGFPKFDPHGDPIPSADGVLPVQSARPLTGFDEGQEVILMGIADHSPDFLAYLDRLHLQVGARLQVERRESFDGSMVVFINGQRQEFLSEKAASEMLVVPV